MSKTMTEIHKGIEQQRIRNSVAALDFFCKSYCRYNNDYELHGDLKFRCEKCLFQQDTGVCLIKKFKCDNAPDYIDFGSMGDL